MFEWNPPRFEVRVDGNRLEGRFCAAVLSNCETYGKGWAVTPGADPTDGALDFQVRRHGLAPFGALALIASSLRTRVPSWLAAYGRGRRVELAAERPMLWQADGDAIEPCTRLMVRVRPGAVRVLAPRVAVVAALPVAG